MTGSLWNAGILSAVGVRVQGTLRSPQAEGTGQIVKLSVLNWYRPLVVAFFAMPPSVRNFGHELD
jgi:hypothetical protein